MRKIYTIGETVYDIIFKNGKPVSAVPGGAMLNSSVTLGRLGFPVFFISEFGTDPVGKQIEKFLAGTTLATEVCLSYDNYISKEFAGRLLSGNSSTSSYPKE